MALILKCNNMDCPVTFFILTHKNDCVQCPICQTPKIEQIEFNEGVDDFRCSNSNCTEYQINPIIDDQSVFICPFCQSKQIDIIKHDLV